MENTVNKRKLYERTENTVNERKLYERTENTVNERNIQFLAKEQMAIRKVFLCITI